MFGITILFAAKGRIADDIDFVFCAVAAGAEGLPVFAQAVGGLNVAAAFEGQGGQAVADFAFVGKVHLVFGKPEGKHGDFVGKVAQLDAEKRVERVSVVEWGVAGVFFDGLEDFDFEAAQLFVGDNQEIAAAAGGIEDFDVAQPHGEAV